MRFDAGQSADDTHTVTPFQTVTLMQSSDNSTFIAANARSRPYSFSAATHT
jgi:hypothetical protein